MNVDAWFTLILLYNLSDIIAAMIAAAKLVRMYKEQTDIELRRFLFCVAAIFIGIWIEGFCFINGYTFRPKYIHYSVIYIAWNLTGRTIRSIGVWIFALYVTGGIKRQ